MLTQLKRFRHTYLAAQRRKKQEKRYNQVIGRHVHSGEDGNALIGKMVLENKPYLISRFGSSELATLLFYLQNKNEDTTPLHWNEHHRHILCDVSGFFPFTPEAMNRFAEMYLSFINNIDVLGVWNVGEENVKHLLRRDVVLVPLSAIEPYYFEQPWSKALAGKKVLVVHPFAESIRQQYSRRASLFPNKDVLLSFDLQTLAAVQTVADNTQGFKDWFAALNYMYEEIAQKDFDVAIIGAGAYGMPLGNFIKTEMKKTAIHMGGATQILFGIKGKRWEDVPKVKALFNEFWIKPSATEKPSGLEKVESGCYW